MSNCRYCANMLPKPAPGAPGRTIWACVQGWALVEGEHGCADYEEKPLLKDDLSAEELG
jgi:hypothetical protein